MTSAALRPPVPTRPWRPLVTVSTVLLSALGAVAALAGVVPMVMTLILASGMLVRGWVLLLNLPTPRGTAGVLAASAAVLLACVLFAGDRGIHWLPAAVAISLIVEFGHQLARRDGRPRLVESVSATVAGIAILASGASLLPLIRQDGGAELVAVLLAAGAVSAAADLIGRRDAPPLLGALVAAGLGAAAAAAGAVLWPAMSVPVIWAAAAGALAGSAGNLVRQVQSVLPYLYGRRAQLASGAGSVLMLGVLAHVATWFGTLG